MRRILPLIVLPLLACQPQAASEAPETTSAPEAPSAPTTDLEELHAFAKLYGYVRFFHPSDEAAVLDWNGFATHGVQRVTQGDDQAALQAALDELFLPVAPTMHLYREGQAPRDAADFFPAKTEGLKVVAWQHRGFGFGDMISAYASGRSNRNQPAPIGPQRNTTVNQEVEVKSLRGKRVRLRGWGRADAEAPQATVRLMIMATTVDPDDRDPRGYSDSRATLQWSPMEAELEVPRLAKDLHAGAEITGRGAAWIDDLRLEVHDGAGWVEVPLEDAGFESEGALDAWDGGAPNFTHERREGGHDSATALRVSRQVHLQPPIFGDEEAPQGGELIEKSLGAGLTVQLPLSLYSRDGQTSGLPGAETPPPLDLSGVPREASDPAVRVAAVVVAWNVYQHFFPYFEVIPADWSAVLDQSLQAAVEDGSAIETYDTLRRLIAQLHDGHAFVGPPVELEQARVPASFARAGDQVVVLVAAEGSPLRRGDVVLAVDGQPIEDRIEQERALTSGSPQWVEHRLLAWSEATTGPRDSTARFSIERDGSTLEVEVLRAYADIPPAFRHEPMETLESGIRYVDLSRAEWTEIFAHIDALASAPGVVFDLRGYPNGTHPVLRHLMTESERDKWMFVPHIVRPDHEGNEVFDEIGWDIDPATPHIEGKVAFITGGGAVSYAESVMGYVEALQLGEIVGGPTAGANGNINPFMVPGGYILNFTGMEVRKRDGSPHHTVGILPTIPAQMTREGIAAGRDELLERAIEAVSG